MQVRLLTSAGFPDDALVSIRAGATRRQAAVSARKALRFPDKDIAEGELKVDLLRKIGQGSVCLKPSKQCTQYRVVLDEGGAIECELVVGDGGAVDRFLAEGGEPQQAEQDAPPPVKPYMSARDSQEYLESIGVLQFVQRVLQQVVKERPRKPYDFIAKQFLRGFDPPEQVQSAMQTDAVDEPAAGGAADAPLEARPPVPAEARLPMEVAAAAAEPAAAAEAPPAPAVQVEAATQTETVICATPRGEPPVLLTPVEAVAVTEADTNFSGFGYREFASGDVYEGEFLDGKRHGRGKYQFSLGDIYDGQWRRDVMHGQGSMQYQEGMYYEGQWANGKHHGSGRYVWIKEHEEYEGDFREDELYGWGRYIYANDEVYEGDFVNSVKHGRGRHILADGRVAFDGEYRNGVPDAAGWLLQLPAATGVPMSTSAAPEASVPPSGPGVAAAGGAAGAAAAADDGGAAGGDGARAAPGAEVAGAARDDDDTSSLGSAGI